MIWALGMGAMALAFSGCKSCGPRPYNIQVDLDPSLRGKSVLVDVVGVNPPSVQRWDNYSMSSYWREGDPLRRDNASDRVSFSFVSGDAASKTLSVTNAQWKAWLGKGVNNIFVLADLPGPHQDKPGDADDRRLKLPIDSCYWSKTNTLNILVQQSGLKVLTPQAPAKK